VHTGSGQKDINLNVATDVEEILDIGNWGIGGIDDTALSCREMFRFSLRPSSETLRCAQGDKRRKQ
jgi:hypothetical protein